MLRTGRHGTRWDSLFLCYVRDDEWGADLRCRKADQLSKLSRVTEETMTRPSQQRLASIERNWLAKILPGRWRRAVVLTLAFVMASTLLAGGAAAQKQKKNDKKPTPDLETRLPMGDAQAIDLMIAQMLGAWQVGDVEMMHKYYADDLTMVSGGPGSGLYKSTDAGDTWTKLQGGLPEGILGKSGVAVSASRPRRLYAIVEAEKGSVYGRDRKSTRLNSSHRL